MTIRLPDHSARKKSANAHERAGIAVRAPTSLANRTRARAVPTTLLATVCLSACGSSEPTLNMTRVEHAIAGSILSQRGLHTTVACPSQIPQKAGRVFTCAARLDAGTYPITVTETNGSGQVRYENPRPLVALNIAKVEHAIAASIARQRGLAATVSCPREVLQKAGIVFTCTAAISSTGRRYPFAVTEVDSAGHVRYVGR